MSRVDDVTIDWKPYEAEILKVFVDQDRTLEFTMKHMRDNHGLRATEKQYKTKFSGYKNLKAKDWNSVAQIIGKRTLEGRDSDVYLHGRPLDPKRVKKNIARYQSRTVDDDSQIAVDASFQDRISVRTPQATLTSPCPSPAAATQHVNFDMFDDFSFGMNISSDIEFNHSSSQLYPRSPSIFARMSPDPGRHIHEDSSLGYSSMHETFSFSEYFEFDMPFSDKYVELRLMRDLPWFRLQNLIETPGIFSLSSVINRIFPSTFLSSNPFNMTNFNPGNLALEKRRSLLHGFLSAGSREDIKDNIPQLTTRLQKLVPERQNGELYTKVQQLFDRSNERPLYQLFEFAMYFSSNNMLSWSQTDNFLKWVIDEKHVTILQSFLQIKTPTVQAFLTRILESGIRISNIKFLQLFINSSVKFDKIIEKAIKIKDPEFLKLLLRIGVDPNLLSGMSGGRLLHSIAATAYVSVASILLQNGADVNFLPPENFRDSALFKAISRGNVDMVKCLLDAGANTDTWNSSYPHIALAEATHCKRFDVVVALLEKDADVNTGSINEESLLEWTALHSRRIYHLFLEKIGRHNGQPTAGDIIIAAEGGNQAFSSFLSQQEEKLSQGRLEKALTESLSLNSFTATSVLLNNGVDPNGTTLPDQNRPLRMAARNAGVEYSQLLINKGASVNLPFLLGEAIEKSDFDLLYLFIDAGANLEIYGPEALVDAVNRGEMEMAALLIDRGTEINAFGPVLSALQKAARDGNSEFGEYLIERGANVNQPARAVKGRTALQAAVESDHIEMVTFLLENGADVNAPAAQVGGLTALEAAVNWEEITEDQVKMFKLLLDRGASIIRPGGQSYWTPSILHRLVKHNQVDAIRLAVEAGVDINRMSSGKRGRTPLQLAAGLGDLPMVRLLLDLGAAVNTPPGYKLGRTALQAAATCESPSKEIIELLIDKGADINAMAGLTGGVTALQGAAIRGHIKIALLLLKKKADVNARPAIKDGRTAIEGAAEWGRLDMVKLLLNAGARGDVTGKSGFKKAIEFAEENRHFAVAQLLRDHEASEGDASMREFDF